MQVPLPLSLIFRPEGIEAGGAGGGAGGACKGQKTGLMEGGGGGGVFSSLVTLTIQK